jgi:hypothetical protein
MKTIKLLITSILLLSSIQAYSIENLYHSSPETRGIRVTIKGDGDKPAPESVTIISSNGDFFKPCPSRAKAGFKKSPSG